MLLGFLLIEETQAQDYPALRARMVAEVDAMYAETRFETGLAAMAPAVRAAMGKVERHRLVPALQVALAYRNHPLPIGSGQTISQPYIVAISTDLLQIDSNSVVLEVGTGSGYQAAVLPAGRKKRRSTASSSPRRRRRSRPRWLRSSSPAAGW